MRSDDEVLLLRLSFFFFFFFFFFSQNVIRGMGYHHRFFGSLEWVFENVVRRRGQERWIERGIFESPIPGSVTSRRDSKRLIAEMLRI